MEDMLVVDDERGFVRRSGRAGGRAGATAGCGRRLLGTAGQGWHAESPRSFEWLFGVLSLVLGLSMLAALPIVQFLSLGLLPGIVREGRADRGEFGTVSWAFARLPEWAESRPESGFRLCRPGLPEPTPGSAELINPGGRSAIFWRIGLVVVTVLAMLHIGVSCLRGGRIRYFLWPFGQPVLAGATAAARRAVHRGPRRALGVRGELAHSLLLSAGVGRVLGHAGLAGDSGSFDRRDRGGAASGADRDAAAGDRRAVLAFPSGALCSRGASLGTFFATGHQGPIPPCAVGLRLLAVRAACSRRFRYTC